MESGVREARSLPAARRLGDGPVAAVVRRRRLAAGPVRRTGCARRIRCRRSVRTMAGQATLGRYCGQAPRLALAGADGRSGLLAHLGASRAIQPRIISGSATILGVYVIWSAN